MPGSPPERTSYAAGVTKATLAAGPVFVWSAAIAAAVDTPRTMGWADAAWLFAGLFPPVVMVGGLLALAPNALGCALLAYLGRGNAGMRLPVLWALVGGLAAGGATWLATRDASPTAAFAATGAVCALLCRHGTRWPDDPSSPRP